LKNLKLCQIKFGENLPKEFPFWIKFQAKENEEILMNFDFKKIFSKDDRDGN